MKSTVSLLELIGRGVSIDASEAIAVVQQLIADQQRAFDGAARSGSLALNDIFIGDDGSVAGLAGATATVSDIARLLDAMLQQSDGMGAKIGGGLRYAIARALMAVDAPPFDSVAEFSENLARFERGPRDVQVRQLYARYAERVTDDEAPLRFDDRRRTAPSAAEFRRQLREADKDRFEKSRATPRSAPPPPRGLPRRTFVLGALAVLLSFASGYMVFHYEGRRSTMDRRAAAATPMPDGAKATASAGRADDTVGEPASIIRAAGPADGPMFSPSFESSGSALFFHTGRTADARSALAAADLGANSRVMTIVDDGAKNYHVQPSPDGTRVAFDSDRDGERGVYVANRDGSNIRRVSGPGFAAVPTWSPDGRRLAFVRAEPQHPRVWNLWLLTLDSGESRRLTSFKYGQTWSASWFPEGRRVCYTHEDRLIVHDLDTRQTREFTTPVRGRLLRTPAVSPDGRRVIFQVARSGAWLLDFEGGEMRCVLTDPTAEEFAWSPDGQRVAFHSRRDGQWGIWLMRPS